MGISLQIGIEDIEPNHWVAWVFDYIGCYANGKTREEALSFVIPETEVFLKWISWSYEETPAVDGYILSEEFHAYSVSSNPQYLVNAFFEDDKRPVLKEEFNLFWAIRNDTQNELAILTGKLEVDRIQQAIPGEKQGSILGILKHMAWTEWWYLDRLDASFDRSEMPDEPFTMIHKVRMNSFDRLEELIRKNLITIKSGETWSPRKIMRRTLWHERSHIKQIQRYLKVVETV